MFDVEHRLCRYAATQTAARYVCVRRRNIVSDSLEKTTVLDC